MNWADLISSASILAQRLPLDRLLFRGRDKAKALEDFVATLPHPAALTPTVNPPQPAPPVVAQPLDIPLDNPHGELTTKEIIDYQNREIGKLLIRMERHYAQRMRINGKPCDCGSRKHLLDMESLCEETVPMVADSSKYYVVMEWIREVGPKSTDEAAKSGKYDKQYPVMSTQARGFRKEIIGTLDPYALFPPTEGEPEEVCPIPVASSGEEEG